MLKKLAPSPLVNACRQVLFLSTTDMSSKSPSGVPSLQVLAASPREEPHTQQTNQPLCVLPTRATEVAEVFWVLGLDSFHHSFPLLFPLASCAWTMPSYTRRRPFQKQCVRDKSGGGRILSNHLILCIGEYCQWPKGSVVYCTREQYDDRWMSR